MSLPFSSTNAGNLLLVPIFIKINLLLDLLLGEPGRPFVKVALHDIGRDPGQEPLRLGNKLSVEALCDFIKTTPMRRQLNVRDSETRSAGGGRPHLRGIDAETQAREVGLTE